MYALINGVVDHIKIKYTKNNELVTYSCNVQHLNRESYVFLTGVISGDVMPVAVGNHILVQDSVEYAILEFGNTEQKYSVTVVTSLKDVQQPSECYLLLDPWM